MNTEKLRQWFFKNHRNLPWRENSSPYEVWVSEVMLQQTQVSVVVPYFKRWMTLFPTITKLAEAQLETVIKAWEGLGYYSRARNLHKGARYFSENHGGEIPSSSAELKKVKGLGPYTIGAILSFAFKRREVAVDGNVLRVLSRFYGIDEPIDTGKVQRKVRELCQVLLPEREPWIIMEGLIELGALVCKKKARCSSCPLQEECVANRTSKVDLLPLKKSREKTIHLHREVAVIHTESELLLRKGEKGKVMAGLAEFPYFERGTPIEDTIDLSLTPICSLSEVFHGFTKYKVFLYPYLYYTLHKEIEGYEWVPFEKISTTPFSSGHRRILQGLSVAKTGILPKRLMALFSKERV